MNTSNENNEPVLSEITKTLKSSSRHKLSVLERKSIRPTTSLKKSFFKVKSLRLKKTTTGQESISDLINIDN